MPTCDAYNLQTGCWPWVKEVKVQVCVGETMSFKRCYQCPAEATYVKKHPYMYFTGLQHTCILRACKVFTGAGLFKCNLDNKEI